MIVLCRLTAQGTFMPSFPLRQMALRGQWMLQVQRSRSTNKKWQRPLSRTIWTISIGRLCSPQYSPHTSTGTQRGADTRPDNRDRGATSGLRMRVALSCVSTRSTALLQSNASEINLFAVERFTHLILFAAGHEITCAMLKKRLTG